MGRAVVWFADLVDETVEQVRLQSVQIWKFLNYQQIVVVHFKLLV